MASAQEAKTPGCLRVAGCSSHEVSNQASSPRHVRVRQLRSLLKALDPRSLHHCGADLLAGDTDILRCALLFVVGCITNDEELKHWERVVAKHRDDEPPARLRRGIIPTIALIPSSISRIGTIDFPVREDIPAIATCSIVAAGFPAAASAATTHLSRAERRYVRDDMPTPEVPVVPKPVPAPSCPNLDSGEADDSAPSEGSLSNMCDFDHEGFDFEPNLSVSGDDSDERPDELQGELSDYPPPEASATCSAAEINLVWATNVDDDDEAPISMGQWLAMQQELRLKDFAIGQLERQLHYERGCNEWLASEYWSREQREEQINILAAGLPEEGQAQWLVGITLDAYQGEDERVEHLFNSHNTGYWAGEARSLQKMYEDMELQSSEDQAELRDEDRSEYDTHIRLLVRRLSVSFQNRRTQAETHQEKRLRGLQRHHDKVRRRHLRQVMPAARGYCSYSTDSADYSRGCLGQVPEVESPEASAVDGGEYFEPGIGDDIGVESESDLSDLSTTEGSSDDSNAAQYDSDGSED